MMMMMMMMGVQKLVVLIMAISWLAVGTDVAAQNITKVLDHQPSFSTINRLLSETGVAKEINIRKSITLLAPDNSVADQALSGLRGEISSQELGDIVRYHVLLQYFDISELQQILKKQTLQVTTLYQTTGRARGMLGFVNITLLKGSMHVTTPVSEHLSSATIVKSVKQIPYNISIFQLSSVLLPVGLLTHASTPGSPLSLPSSTPEPAAAPTPASVSSPAPVTVPVSSPPAPPADVSSPLSEAPSGPSKNSAFPSFAPQNVISAGLLVHMVLLFLHHQF